MSDPVERVPSNRGTRIAAAGSRFQGNSRGGQRSPASLSSRERTLGEPISHGTAPNFARYVPPRPCDYTEPNQTIFARFPLPLGPPIILPCSRFRGHGRSSSAEPSSRAHCNADLDFRRSVRFDANRGNCLGTRRGGGSRNECSEPFADKLEGNVHAYPYR